jgi:hypothetical protein
MGGRLSSAGFFASDWAKELDEHTATNSDKQSSRKALGLINLLACSM